MSTVSPEDVRVVTTLGHVDHGKTTFVDYLLAANNIISSRLAGKVRYMDSREDEQERGITMESSAVSLRFRVLEKSKDSDPGIAQRERTYVVNLVDTPGHVDFSGEVSSASRICDGALVLVDVVEGVCTQTITVLRQAWLDRIRPILVLNKCDRLITELKLAPVEAYHHLSRLIEQVNAVMGSFFAGERMEDDLRWREERENRLKKRKENLEAGISDLNDDVENQEEFQEKDDEDIYFAPDKGNVIFASAIDGWGFRVGKFAQLYAAKLGAKEANLRRALWGDFYLDPKTKRIIGHKQLKGRSLKPMFVQFVLENIWAAYDAIVLNTDPGKVEKIVKTLNLKILPRDLKSKDTRQLLQLIFGQWLSLSTCTIQAVIDIVPAPSAAQKTRMPKMLYPDLNDSTIEAKSEIEKALYACDTSANAPVVAYVSKTFAVAKSDFPEKKRKPVTAEELRQRAREARSERQDTNTETFAGSDANRVSPEDVEGDSNEGTSILGFARLYSGVLRVGASVYCVLPKYDTNFDPAHPRNAGHLVTAKVEGLYTMMGRELEAVDMVKAGNIFAIRGLEGKVWRNATLCSLGMSRPLSNDAANDRQFLLNLGRAQRQPPPIVRVALEPVEPAQLPQLVEGLRLLNQSDPVVETFQQQTGEYVILTAGELHLERCLKDLRERFAKIEIQALEPIVPFRETAKNATEMPPLKNPSDPRGTIRGSSAHSVVTYTLRAVPIPPEIVAFIHDHTDTIRRINDEKKAIDAVQEVRSEELEDEEDLFGQEHFDGNSLSIKKPEDFWEGLRRLCEKHEKEWKNVAERIWAFGPHSIGTCMLIDCRVNDHHSLWKKNLTSQTLNGSSKEQNRLIVDFENCIETGFQLGTLKGPLCAEPVEGIAYFLESLHYDLDAAVLKNAQSVLPQVTGSLIKGVQEACKAGLLEWSPRLMMAMYSCDIQASTEVLGKVYGVVAKRRGRIVSEEIKEGTSFFTVTARIPVVESFGFADDIRKRTSGAASPQLIFSGYELLDQDPFWVPSTEEELEDLGEKADRENVAKAYMDRVRERKGLFVDRKIVAIAEQQRTLKR